MATPDLDCLLKKDYFILYQQQKKVPLKSTLVMECPTQSDTSNSMRAAADGSGMNMSEGNKLEDNEMVIDDEGEHLMGIQDSDDAENQGGHFKIAGTPVGLKTTKIDHEKPSEAE